LIVRAWDRRRGGQRRKVIIPDTAHGTNPASCALAGFAVVVAKTGPRGYLEAGEIRRLLDDQVAALMVTNPNTLGIFEAEIREIAAALHECGALLYLDGANLNALLGVAKPGHMGADVVHVNLHKTFSTPHGGGGPGAGAVGVSTRLQPFLPIPIVGKEGERYRWLTEKDLPQSIGRLSAFMGNAGVLLRAYIYMRMLGREGMSRVGEYATLNANYLLALLRKRGFEPAYPSRRASHEFIVTLKKQARELEVTAMDFAKRLLDHGFHAPTTYFPLLVPECLLIEPTETEGKDTLDAFAAAMAQIQTEAEQEPERVTSAPHTMPVRRLDDVRAAKQLDLTWKPTVQS
ncbi:MAG: aminomethyl-transferring glycine dehydrogenase subunit GcvPB, partial [Steroidobacteraceae bacterium]